MAIPGAPLPARGSLAGPEGDQDRDWPTGTPRDAASCLRNPPHGVTRASLAGQGGLAGQG
jgi:hypothetical protein